MLTLSRLSMTLGVLTRPMGKARGSGWSSLERWMPKGRPRSFCSVRHEIPRAAKRFFSKTPGASHKVTPRVMTVDTTSAYPKALNKLKAGGSVFACCELRQVNSRNANVEQDQNFIKQLVEPGLGCFSFATAWRTTQHTKR